MRKTLLSVMAALMMLTLLVRQLIAEPATDVPHRPPITSTGFVCVVAGSGPKIVAVVVSYSDGSAVRFDAAHMHGFTPLQLIVYADSAKDSRVYEAPCVSDTVT